MRFSEYLAHAWAALLMLPETGHRIRDASLEWDVPPWPDKATWGMTKEQMAALPPPAALRSKQPAPSGGEPSP